MVISQWPSNDYEACMKSVEYNCKVFAYADSGFLRCVV